ncbi:hypothetical protein JCM3766R1_002659 [Sporobolomyces carnicolor]
MGAICGKEDHFESLGNGNTLARQPTPHQPRQKPSAAARPPQRLGGSDAAQAQRSQTGTPTGAQPDREAMLRAAEARSKAAETRGTKAGAGSLSKKLEQQKKDGGRRQEAELEADRRGNEPLVWD